VQADVVAVPVVGVTAPVAAAVAVEDVAGALAVAAVLALTLAAAAAVALAGWLADDGDAIGAELDEVAAHPALASASAAAKMAAPHPPGIRVPVIAATPCNRDECYARS
jgi:hypothetical protein